MKKIILFLYCNIVAFPVLGSMPYQPLIAYHYDSSCPLDKPFRPNDVRFYECKGCDDLDSIYFNIKEINDFKVCKNREILEGSYSVLKKCPENYFRGNDGSCLSCQKLEKVQVKKPKDCSLCPNRETKTIEYKYNNNVEVYHYCQFKRCPDDAPLQGDGDCLPCDAPYWTEDVEGVCDKCPNRQFVKKGDVVYIGVKDRALDGKYKRQRYSKQVASSGCYLRGNKKEPLFEVGQKEEWIKGKEDDVIAESEGLFIGNIDDDIYVYSSCCGTTQWQCDHRQGPYSCDVIFSVSTLPEICARCPNREYIKGKCLFKECLNKNMVRFKDNTCISCSDNEASLYFNGNDVSEKECQKCSDRRYKNDRCCLKNEVVGIKDLERGKECISCGVSDFYTTKEECDRCPERIFKNGKCIIGCDIGYKMNDDEYCIRKWYNFFDWMRIYR